jgi:hypothetical protein
MTNTVLENEIVDTEIREKLLLLREYRLTRDKLEEMIKTLNSEISEAVKKRARFTDETGQIWTASVVRKEDVVVNLEMLREIDEDLYIDSTKRVLDRQAFEQLIRSGAIIPDIAVQVAHFKQQNPYVVFKKAEESDSE